ncbi:MAG: protoporphyrinogen oxidase [Bacteroidales bacterium]|nr:protoporphyrinogen oxidase [Bacteroidales bacterium]
MKKKTAIIGSGITGLTIAYYLKKEGVDFKLFEKTNHIGGVIKTISKNGFVYETGPNSGTLSNIETVELFENLSTDFEIDFADKSAAKRLILKNNEWHALPSGIFSAISTPLFSLKDKFRILGEPFRKPGKNPFETIADLVVRRLGKSFLDYAIDPFISGIYAGDPDYLVTKYALPKLYNLEQKYGSFIGGAVKKAKEHKTANDKKITKEIFSAKGGLSSVVKALEKFVGKDKIVLNANIRVEKENDLYVIGKEKFTHIINTSNTEELLHLFPFLSKDDIKDIINLKYAEVIEAAIGFNEWKGINLNAFGGLIPSKEDKNLLGILFMSTLFKNRAPENGALITVFVGGTKNKQITKQSEKDLIYILKTELQELLGLADFKPDLFKLFYHKRAIAQYGADSEKRLQAIKAIESKYKNLYLAGSMRDGVGLADRIKQATQAAKIIIES